MIQNGNFIEKEINIQPQPIIDKEVYKNKFKK